MGRTIRNQIMERPPPGSLVDIYARYSSDMQDGVTLFTQITRSQSRAMSYGWIVRTVWQEPETSAKYDVEDLAKRPQFAALLAEAEAHQMHAILCWKSDRWARNVGMSSVTLANLRKWGIWWETADGEFDIERIRRGAGKLTHTIKAALDESYVDTVSDHSAAGKATRAAQGYHNSSVVPFGYLMPDYPPRPAGAPAMWKPPRMPLRLDPERAPVVRQIGEWYVCGMSYREIADTLNQQGVRHRLYGNRRSIYVPEAEEIPWTKDGIYSIMRCVMYREFTPDTGRGTVIAPDGEQVMGLHPAIWPYDLWQRIETLRATRYGNPHSGSRNRAIYPFAGIITCAGCGNAMRAFTVRPTQWRNRYYECRTRSRGGVCAEARHITNADVIEGVFGQLLDTYRLGDTWRADLEALLGLDTDATYWETIAAQRDALERAKSRVNVMFRAGGIEEATYLRDIADLNRQITALPAPDSRQTEEAISAGAALALLPEAWRDGTSAERRTIVASLLRMLRWSHDWQTIMALAPLPEYLPSLALLLTHHGWRQEGDTLVRSPDQVILAAPVPGGKLTLRQQVDIVRRAAAGEKLTDLARDYGVFHATIWRIVKHPRRDLRLFFEKDTSS
jgi:DNA invertase Pin-like site-specific DNA recombinase